MGNECSSWRWLDVSGLEIIKARKKTVEDEEEQELEEEGPRSLRECRGMQGAGGEWWHEKQWWQMQPAGSGHRRALWMKWWHQISPQAQQQLHEEEEDKKEEEKEEEKRKNEKPPYSRRHPLSWKWTLRHVCTFFIHAIVWHHVWLTLLSIIWL